MKINRSVILAVTAVLALAFVASSLFVGPTVFAQGATANGHFNQRGNLLISDQFNNRVIEVNPLTKQIVWSFGSGNPKLCNPGPNSVIGSNYAERLSGGLTLIAGTGIPAGVPGTKACVDNRVIVVDESGKIVWQYGKAGKTGSGPDLLNVPVAAIQLSNHDFLITDQGNNRIIEVNMQKQIVWSYGPKSGPGALNSPNSAELLGNGHILIADEGNNRVIEITRSGNIVWQYSKGISGAAFASRLPNGDTLITDSGHARIFEVTPSKQIVFQYFTDTSRRSNSAPDPSNAVRIAGGDTIIADQFNDRIIVINSAKQVVFQYGETNRSGNGFDRVFGPYTGFEIGDYIGQTPPPSNFY